MSFAVSLSKQKVLVFGAIYTRDKPQMVAIYDTKTRSQETLSEFRRVIGRASGLGVHRPAKHPSCLYVLTHLAMGTYIPGSRDEDIQYHAKVYLFCGGRLAAQSGSFRYAERSADYGLAEAPPKDRSEHYTIPSSYGYKLGFETRGGVFLRDVNRDGWEDVVLWQRRKVARKLKPGESTNLSERSSREKQFGPLVISLPDKLLVMFYDPAEKQFSEFQEMQNLPSPGEKLWFKLPDRFKFGQYSGFAW